MGIQRRDTGEGKEQRGGMRTPGKGTIRNTFRLIEWHVCPELIDEEADDDEGNEEEDEDEYGDDGGNDERRGEEEEEAKADNGV